MKLIEITFDIPLAAYQIPQFRGAMVETLGREFDRFHNHKGDEYYHYRYPLVQYRQKQGKASLLILGEPQIHAEDVAEIVEHSSESIRIGNKTHLLNIANIEARQVDLHITQKPHSYQLYHWIALNKENYQYWQENTGLTKRVQLLERLLTNHIMKFAAGMNWFPEAKLEVEITSLDQMKFLRLHGVKHLSFDVSFRVNAELPYQIGLGKGVTYGFGILKSQRRR